MTCTSTAQSVQTLPMSAFDNCTFKTPNAKYFKYVSALRMGSSTYIHGTCALYFDMTTISQFDQARSTREVTIGINSPQRADISHLGFAKNDKGQWFFIGKPAGESTDKYGPSSFTESKNGDDKPRMLMRRSLPSWT